MRPKCHEGGSQEENDCDPLWCRTIKCLVSVVAQLVNDYLGADSDNTKIQRNGQADRKHSGHGPLSPRHDGDSAQREEGDECSTRAQEAEVPKSLQARQLAQASFCADRAHSAACEAQRR